MKNLIIILLTTCVLSCNQEKNISPMSIDISNTTYVHFDHISDTDSVFSVLEFKNNVVDINYKTLDNKKVINIDSFKYIFTAPKLFVANSDNSISEGILSGDTLKFGGLNYIKR